MEMTIKTYINYINTVTHMLLTIDMENCQKWKKKNIHIGRKKEMQTTSFYKHLLYKTDLQNKV
jgi:hypothetical protein